MVLRRFLIAIALLVATALQAHAAGKVALVIGNGAYQNANPLPNPTNDANDMIAKLKELGFEVFGGTDLTFVDMGSKIGEFEDAARDADVTLLFYAGHGMQVNGRNYLVPVDAKLERESSLRFQTIDSEDVLRAMAGPGKTAIALLDACRDNPLSRRFARSLASTRSNAVGQGLAVPNITGGGMLIGFATAPGDVAADGDGRNSPFTTALLKHISTPGLEIQQLMTRVKREVYNSTKEDQEPWHNSSLRDEVYLGGLPVQAEPAPKVEADNTTVSAEWNLVKDTGSVAVLDAFMAAYADKPLFVALAQDRKNVIAALEAAEAAKAQTSAEKDVLAAADAVAAEQKARLEEIERQRAEIEKGQSELDAAKAEKQKVREEAEKLKAEQEAALAEIAKQKAEIAKSMDLLEAQLKAKLPAEQQPPPQQQAVVDTPSPPPGEEVGKDSFLNFFFGETPQAQQDAAPAPPPIETPPPEQQLALNDTPAPPADTGNAAFDEFLIAAIAANNGEISQAFMLGNQVLVPPPPKNPGTKTRALAAKRIASAASMDELLQNNPGLTFEFSSAQNCRVDFINTCKLLPQGLKDSIANRFSSLGIDISGQQSSNSYFFAQPIAGSKYYLISNSPHLKTDTTPAAVVASVVDVNLTVVKNFYIPLSNQNQGVQADPQFGNISITWAAMEGDDIILSLDSGSRCDEKPRFMGLMLRVGLADMGVKWVSPFNVVNDNFIVTDKYIYSADGGSCQEDHVYQLDKSTGGVLARMKVKTSADELWLDGDRLVLQLYEGAEVWQLK